MKKMKPVHEHDCDSCIYLKTISENKVKYDLYYCGVRDGRKTVIARYGTDGDYSSGLGFAYKGPLKKAAMLSMRMGLINEYEYAEAIAHIFNPRISAKLILNLKWKDE